MMQVLSLVLSLSSTRIAIGWDNNAEAKRSYNAQQSACWQQAGEYEICKAFEGDNDEMNTKYHSHWTNSDIISTTRKYNMRSLLCPDWQAMSCVCMIRTPFAEIGILAYCSFVSTDFCRNGLHHVAGADLDNFIMHTGAPWAAIHQALQETLEVGQLDEQILAAQCPHPGGFTALLLLLLGQRKHVSCSVPILCTISAGALHYFSMHIYSTFVVLLNLIVCRRHDESTAEPNDYNRRGESQ